MKQHETVDTLPDHHVKTNNHLLSEPRQTKGEEANATLEGPSLRLETTHRYQKRNHSLLTCAPSEEHILAAQHSAENSRLGFIQLARGQTQDGFLVGVGLHLNQSTRTLSRKTNNMEVLKHKRALMIQSTHRAEVGFTP